MGFILISLMILIGIASYFLGNLRAKILGLQIKKILNHLVIIMGTT
jgi:hypothetical protein